MQLNSSRNGPELLAFSRIPAALPPGGRLLDRE